MALLARPENQSPSLTTSPAAFAAERADRHRSESLRATKSSQGQFFTPLPVARFMAAQFTPSGAWALLDPGAGTGTLSCAVLERSVLEEGCTDARLTAYETDPDVLPHLSDALAYARDWAAERGTEFVYEIRSDDFVSAAADNLWSTPARSEVFQRSICNPPYFKLSARDPRTNLLRNLGPWPPNMYALFMMLIARALDTHGEMVTITPRSFSSGSYFRAFRSWFFSIVVPQRVHLFDSRTAVFEDEAVLQESLIVKWGRGPARSNARVSLSTSHGPITQSRPPSVRDVDLKDVLHSTHRDTLFTLPATDDDAVVRGIFSKWKGRLEEFGWQASTGPVVPFRSREWLRDISGPTVPNSAPFLWMQSVRVMSVEWPWSELKKPQLITEPENSGPPRLVPDQNMVLLRRFSPKEDERRIVAAPLLQSQLGADRIGIENHINYIYGDSSPLSENECCGLAAFLNSRLVDTYVRTTNGNTQISATELRALPLPSKAELAQLGKANPADLPAIDELVNRALLSSQ